MSARRPTDRRSVTGVRVITSRVRPFHLPDLWRWRYLIYLFVKRDFAIFFQQTVLGPLWYLLQPLAATAVLTIVFGRIVKLPTENVPPFLFYFLGSVVWSFFSFCFTQTSRILTAGAREFGYAPFPRLTVPIATVFSGLIQFVLQFGFFFVVYLVHVRGWERFSITVLFVPMAIVQLALLGMGGGLLVSALTSKYRDLSYLVGFCVQLLYFCTPVVYPLSMVQQPWRYWFRYNPLTSVMEVFRRGFFSTGSLTVDEYMVGWVITTVLFWIGLFVFNCIEKTAMDTI